MCQKSNINVSSLVLSVQPDYNFFFVPKFIFLKVLGRFPLSVRIVSSEGDGFSVRNGKVCFHPYVRIQYILRVCQGPRVHGLVLFR